MVKCLGKMGTIGLEYGKVHILQLPFWVPPMCVSYKIPELKKLNSTWVRALAVPMHLGLETGPLCPIL
jgi:hypothetical protein